MNKQFLAITSAFVMGAGVSFLITKKLLEGKYARFAQEEIDSVKERFILREHTSRYSKTDEADSATNDIIGGSSLKGTRTEKIDEHKTRYDLMYSARDGMDGKYHVERPMIIEKEDIPDEPEDPIQTPYTIDEEDFSEDFLHHDKLTLMYYREEGILAEENGTTIEDVDRTIGFENIDSYERDALAYKNPPNTLYIRNERIGEDYEIMMIDGSYVELVVGVDAGLSPRQKQEKYAQKRRKAEEE